MNYVNIFVLAYQGKKLLQKPVSSQDILLNYLFPAVVIALTSHYQDKIELIITSTLLIFIYVHSTIKRTNILISSVNLFNYYCLVDFKIRNFELDQLEILQIVLIISSRILQQENQNIVLKLSTEILGLVFTILRMFGSFTMKQRFSITMSFWILFKLKDLVNNPPELQIRKAFTLIILVGLIKVELVYLDNFKLFLSIMLLITALIAMNDLPDILFDDEGQILPRIDCTSEEPFSKQERIIRKLVFILDKLVILVVTIYGFVLFSQGNKFIFCILTTLFIISALIIQLFTNKEQYLQDNRIFGISILLTYLFQFLPDYIHLLALFGAFITFVSFVKKLIVLTQNQQDFNNAQARDVQSDFSNYFLLSIVLSLLYLSTCKSYITNLLYIGIAVFIFFMQLISEITVNGTESLLALFGIYEPLHLILQNEFTTPKGIYHCLLTAAKSNQMQFYNILVDKIPTTQEKGKETIAHSAAEFGSYQVLQFLIKNNVYQKLETARFVNKTPFDTACSFSTPRVVSLLFQYNTQSFENYRSSPLHFAAHHGNYRVFHLLKRFINQKDHNGRTALQCAALHNYPKTIGYLKDEIDTKDDFGRSVTQIALECQNFDFASKLNQKSLDLIGNGNDFYSEGIFKNYFTDGSTDIFDRKQVNINMKLEKMQKVLWE